MRHAIDKAAFTTLMEALASTFGKQADKAMLLGYWLGLKDLTESALENAVQRAIVQCKFMPKPAELRELAGILSAAAQATLAFSDVERALVSCGYYKSPDFDDRAINATIRNLGGWKRVCELEPEEFDKWFRKDFERVYQVYIERGVGEEAGQPLIGFYEQHNALVGHQVQQPVRIESSLPRQVLALHRPAESKPLIERQPVAMIELKKP